MLNSYLDARHGAVKRETLLRDTRIISELRAAIDAVEHAGNGVVSLADRGATVPTQPWDGLLTDLDTDLLAEATKVVLGAERPVHRGRTEWDAGGINALSMGMRLQQSPPSFTWAPPPDAVRNPLTTPPRLRLVPAAREHTAGAGARPP